jgi:hypothetical protein
LICYVETPPMFPNNFIYVWTLRAGYWIEFCMKLISKISHYNYYSKFYHSWYNDRLLPLVRQFFILQIELMSL